MRSLGDIFVCINYKGFRVSEFQSFRVSDSKFKFQVQSSKYRNHVPQFVKNLLFRVLPHGEMSEGQRGHFKSQIPNSKFQAPRSPINLQNSPLGFSRHMVAMNSSLHRGCMLVTNTDAGAGD